MSDNARLEWKRFTKRNMPEGETQILVCRDYTEYDRLGMFYTVVNVSCGMMDYKSYDGIREFVPESRDRWTYIPRPESR